jgi:hypothetical protein
MEKTGDGDRRRRLGLKGFLFIACQTGNKAKALDSQLLTIN